MSKTHRAGYYFSMLSSIKRLIEDDFKMLSNENYKDKIERFGYKHSTVNNEEMNVQNIEDTLKEKLESFKKEKCEKVTGIYVFTEISQRIIDEKWNEYSEDKSVPAINKKLKDKNAKIFYVGKSNDLIKRLNDHILGTSINRETQQKGWSTTSGLKLSGFIKENPSFKFQIDIFYITGEPEYNALNQLVEAILHKSLGPKLGSARS